MATNSEPGEWIFQMGSDSEYRVQVGGWTVFGGTMFFRGPGASGTMRGEFSHPFPLPTEKDALAFRRAIVAGLAQACGGSVTWPTEAPTRPLDCGDNSCMSPERSQGGMRTNGGCRCHLEDLARAHERRAAWWRRSPNYERSERDRLAILAATEAEATDA